MHKLTDGPKFLATFQHWYERFRPLFFLRFLSDSDGVGEYRVVDAPEVQQRGDDAEQARWFEEPMQAKMLCRHGLFLWT